MNVSPLHPQFVHLPLALAVLLPLLNLGLFISWWRGWLPRRAWVISTALHAVMTLSAFVAMQTGETDERTAERVVSEHQIREHEESAELFLWASVAALLLALIAAIAEEEKVARRCALGTTVIAALCALLAFETGQHGGELVYKYGAGRAFSPAKYGGVADRPHSDTPALYVDDRADEDGESDEHHSK
jgi:uncharacterized membrane protein